MNKENKMMILEIIQSSWTKKTFYLQCLKITYQINNLISEVKVEMR